MLICDVSVCSIVCKPLLFTQCCICLSYHGSQLGRRMSSSKRIIHLVEIIKGLMASLFTNLAWCSKVARTGVDTGRVLRSGSFIVLSWLSTKVRLLKWTTMRLSRLLVLRKTMLREQMLLRESLLLLMRGSEWLLLLHFVSWSKISSTCFVREQGKVWFVRNNNMFLIK